MKDKDTVSVEIETMDVPDNIQKDINILAELVDKAVQEKVSWSLPFKGQHLMKR